MRSLYPFLLCAIFAVSIKAEAPVAHYQHDGPALLPDAKMTPVANF
jgi:hypothetical protein